MLKAVLIIGLLLSPFVFAEVGTYDSVRNDSENENPDKIYESTWVSLGSIKMPFGGKVMTDESKRDDRKVAMHFK